MGQMLIRNIEDEVILQLEAKAKAAGISLEELARRALREAAETSREELWAEIDRIRGLSPKSDFDSTQIIREGRDRGWREF